MMSSPWALILLYLTVLSFAIGYKLPLPDQSFLTDPHSRGEYSSSTLMWEWETDKSDETLLTLIRKVREVSDKMITQPVSKPPLDKSPVVIPKIVLPSKVPYTKPQTMAQLSEDETATLSEQNHISTNEENLNGTVTTQTDKPLTAAVTTIATQMKFTSTQEQLSTPSPTKLKDVSVFTESTTKEAITFNQIHSTTNKVVSSTPDSSRSTVVEETTSIVPSKMPNTTPPEPILTSTASTTHGKTTGWIPDPKGSSTAPVLVTHISTISEDKILTQSLIRQCMLAILILAVVCTIFIISTIALAAKLTTLRQKQKLRHPATYTEMRCISSLLPESDQSKAKPKRLKTFAAMEESDGDNTTLNSFLPEH
ncbi:P-selectin glycoprotein ligand 1 [Mantella aurantiaca]